MTTGYESGFYRDAGDMRKALERIADNTAQIAFVLDEILTELVAHGKRREQEGEKPEYDTPETAEEKARRAIEIVNKTKEAFGHE